MSRTLVAIAGILFCSTCAFGQDFVPKNTTFKTNRASFQPPSSTFTPVQEKSEPPAPPINQTQATIQPTPVQQQPTIILPAKQEPETIVELPQPKAEMEVVELKADTQKYNSTGHNNIYGVSDYRIEVARERARARRMRMEAKKWYGIDPARPAVAPRGHLPTYSAYYNGVFSRPGYQYNHGASFYFHMPVNR